MTDKHIIIDGVDVSGCLFYQTNFEEDYDVKIKHYCSNWHNSCESNNNSNCYYKQLQREKQNSQEARDAAIKEFNKAEELKTLLKRKEQECEELKKEIYKLNSTIDFVKVTEHSAINKYNKLKQTFTEIKEIAENAEEQCAIPENYFKRNNVSWKQHQLKGLTCKFKQILQKIIEVENANI